MAKHHAKHHREAGGLVEEKKPKIDYRTPKGDKEEGEAESEKDSFKHGGRMKHHMKHGGKHRKHGGHVDGEKPHHRLDKRAKGGRMGGSHSPFSHAASVEGRPGGKYDGGDSIDKESD